MVEEYSFDNRLTINAEKIINCYMSFSSYDVQNRIDEYINKKSNGIDSLIKIENQQIEKLK